MVLVSFTPFADGTINIDYAAGELSALNGIAGAMTEQVKVIHVVGQTTRNMQKNRMVSRL